MNVLRCGAVVVLLLSLSGLFAMAREGEQPGWIFLVRDGGQVRISSYANVDTETVLYYRLTTEKIGPDGTATTSQAGSVDLKGGVDTALSRVTLGLHALDRLVVTLELFREGEQIGYVTAFCPVLN